MNNEERPDEKFGEEKPSKLPYEGQETVPENASGGIITATGIAGAFAIMVGMGAVYTEGYGLFDFDDSLPQGSQKVPVTIAEPKP